MHLKTIKKKKKLKAVLFFSDVTTPVVGESIELQNGDIHSRLDGEETFSTNDSESPPSLQLVSIPDTQDASTNKILPHAPGFSLFETVDKFLGMQAIN